jgi:hypothetical protein
MTIQSKHIFIYTNKGYYNGRQSFEIVKDLDIYINGSEIAIDEHSVFFHPDLTKDTALRNVFVIIYIPLK